MWANPPFSSLDECVRKVVAERPTMVLIVPDWPWADWWRSLQSLVSREEYFPQGTRLFQLHGRRSRPIKWGVWAYLLDPHNRYSPSQGVRDESGAPRSPVLVHQQVDTPQDTFRRLRDRSEFDPSRHWKIVTWNVNGLRAMARKRWLRDLLEEEKPDVLCLQEVKLQADAQQRVAPFKGYVMFTSCCTTKKGYSGTRTYVRPGLAQSVRYGLEGEDPGEGRVLTVELPDCFIVNVYVPYAGKELERHSYRVETWDAKFKAYVLRLQQTKPVIVAGDLNVELYEIDRFQFKPEAHMEKLGGYTPQERANFSELLRAARLLDAFRWLYPNERHSYSIWEMRSGRRDRNEGWRLDYFRIPEGYRDRLLECYMLPHMMGSDHCPVAMWLEKPTSPRSVEIPPLKNLSKRVQFSDPLSVETPISVSEKGGGNADAVDPSISPRPE